MGFYNPSPKPTLTQAAGVKAKKIGMKLLKIVGIIVLVPVVLVVGFFVYSYLENIATNGALDKWESSKITTYFDLKTVRQSAVNDYVVALLDNQYEFTYQCHDSGLGTIFTERVRCQAKIKDGVPVSNFKKFLFWIHRDEIKKIIDKYPNFDYSFPIGSWDYDKDNDFSGNGSVTYGGHSITELETFMQEILAIPHFTALRNYCQNIGSPIGDHCYQSDFVIIIEHLDQSGLNETELDELVRPYLPIVKIRIKSYS